MNRKKAIVVGAGIVGLATARALAIKGFQVDVFERTFGAVGASIRNFGMIWPIGQPSGTLYDRAMRSRSIWKSISETGAFWHDAVGSLHVAYTPDELEVLQELATLFHKERKCRFVPTNELQSLSTSIRAEGCKGALFSPDEVIVDPREAITALPEYLENMHGVVFHWGKCVTYVSGQMIYVGNGEQWEADIIFICSGSDFETLYPEYYQQLPLTKCKLQMMRTAPQPGGLRIGPALCGGLSLIHYKSFQEATSLKLLRDRLEQQYPEYIRWGIHVMVSQNRVGELTIGDSHEYGPTHDPFDRAFINKMILDYLQQFVQVNDLMIQETWNGVYAKSTDGASEVFLSPEPGVYILNALSGAGMTLSFGLAEEMVEKL
jgi:FAD dependent oxidoreductase TIGR03364